MCHMETSLTNKIDFDRIHPMSDKKVLEGLEMPLTYCLPFVLFFTDAEMMMFWVSTLSDYSMWTKAFQRLLKTPKQQKMRTNYVLRLKENNFLTSLYVSLKRKPVTEQEIELANDGFLNNSVTMKGELTECMQSVDDGEEESRMMMF